MAWQLLLTFLTTIFLAGQCEEPFLSLYRCG